METSHAIMLGGIQARIELGPYNSNSHTTSYFRFDRFTKKFFLDFFDPGPLIKGACIHSFVTDFIFIGKIKLAFFQIMYARIGHGCQSAALHRLNSDC